MSVKQQTDNSPKARSDSLASKSSKKSEHNKHLKPNKSASDWKSKPDHNASNASNKPVDSQTSIKNEPLNDTTSANDNTNSTTHLLSSNLNDSKESNDSSPKSKESPDFDRGPPLAPESINYMRTLSDQLETLLINRCLTEIKEELDLLSNALIKQVKESPFRTLVNRQGSQLFEKFLSVASIDSSTVMLQTITPYVRYLAEDRLSSHVMQTLFSRAPSFLKEEFDTDSQSSNKSFTSAFKYAMNSLFDGDRNVFIDEHCSHVVRTCIEALCGKVA